MAGRVINGVEDICVPSQVTLAEPAPLAPLSAMTEPDTITSSTGNATLMGKLQSFDHSVYCFCLSKPGMVQIRFDSPFFMPEIGMAGPPIPDRRNQSMNASFDPRVGVRSGAVEAGRALGRAPAGLVVGIDGDAGRVDERGCPVRRRALRSGAHLHAPGRDCGLTDGLLLRRAAARLAVAVDGVALNLAGDARRAGQARRGAGQHRVGGAIGLVLGRVLGRGHVESTRVGDGSVAPPRVRRASLRCISRLPTLAAAPRVACRCRRVGTVGEGAATSLPRASSSSRCL